MSNPTHSLVFHLPTRCVNRLWIYKQLQQLGESLGSFLQLASNDCHGASVPPITDCPDCMYLRLTVLEKLLLITILKVICHCVDPSEGRSTIDDLI